MLIGILALQGDFAKHQEMLGSLGVATQLVRQPADLVGCDGLIIPGGESTVMLRQLDFIQMKPAVIEFAQRKPLFGTCAGLILMSRAVEESSMQPLGLLDITVKRNAFGRQIDSFQAPVSLQLKQSHGSLLHGHLFHAFFIRAPRIQTVGSTVEVLASYADAPILVRQGRHLGASFHPELTSDTSIHRYFIEMVKQYSSPL